MSERMNEAWNDVADGFSKLGGAMKGKFGSDAEGPEPGQQLTAAGDALRDALDRLVSAANEVGQRTVGVVKDEDVRDRVKSVATSLNDALSATVDLIGREVSALFSRPAERSTAADDSDAQPATIDVGGDAIADIDDGRPTPEGHGSAV